MAEYKLTMPDDKPQFSKEEEKIEQLWKDTRAFERQLEMSEGKPEYVFYDGPPFATGTPHYGHILAGTIKDVSMARGLLPLGEMVQTKSELWCRRSAPASPRRPAFTCR